MPSSVQMISLPRWFKGKLGFLSHLALPTTKMSSAPSCVHPAVLELFCACLEERKKLRALLKIQLQMLNCSYLFLSLLFTQGFYPGSSTSVPFRTEQDIHRAQHSCHLLSENRWFCFQHVIGSSSLRRMWSYH